MSQVNLAVTSMFNYDLIILKETVINKLLLFHDHFYNTLTKRSKIINHLCLMLFCTLYFKYKLTKAN